MKYLFATYGESGWRGVQLRALRIASYLPRNEVIFWNSYDSEIIKEWGFSVETKMSGLLSPDQIVFPDGVETVVFSDIPSNELFEYCIFRAAQKQNKKIVICEQLYRRNQLKEFVFKSYVDQCDLMLLNTLSSLESKQNDHISFVPPQIETNLDKNIREKIINKYRLTPNSPLIFGAGYNQEVLQKIKTIAARFYEDGVNATIVVSGPSSLKSTIKQQNLWMLPYVSGDEYFQLLASCDIALVKFGYLQILESLALTKPTIVLGGAGALLQNKDALDPTLKKNLDFIDEVDENAIATIKKLLTNADYRTEKIHSLKKLHDGSVFGAKIAAEKISSLKPRTKEKPVKKLAILVNEEITTYKLWLKRNPDVFPLCFVATMPTEFESVKRFPDGFLTTPIENFQTDETDDLLPHSFKNIFLFSKRKFHGFTDISGWFDTWLIQVTDMMKQADRIFLTQQGKKILDNTIAHYLLEEKIKYLK